MPPSREAVRKGAPVVDADATRRPVEEERILGRLIAAETIAGGSNVELVAEVACLLEEANALGARFGGGEFRLLTSGDPESVARVAETLLGSPVFAISPTS